MPLFVRCADLQPGMRLAEAIIHGGRTMLPGGKVLTQADVDALARRFPELTSRVTDPILDDMFEFEDDSAERQVATRVQQQIAGAMSEVTERFTSRASLATVNFEAVQNSVAEVTKFLEDHPVSAALLSGCLDSKSYLADHAGNVFYLSMALGAAVREYVSEERQRQSSARALRRPYTMSLTSLGLGAMFIDLGMTPLEHLFHCDRPMTKEERQAVRDHPGVGADLLPESFPSVARMVVRTHHENMDGTGYPQRLHDHQLHIFTRIIRIADAYDAATAQHVYKQAKSPARVIWEMSRGPYRHYYDRQLVKVFARLIQPFPIGAKLRLLDGRYAVVVRYNRRNPFLPTVVIAFDSQGRPLPRKRIEGPIDLDERRDLRVRSFGQEHLGFVYDTAPPEDLVPPRRAFHTLYESAFP